MRFRQSSRTDCTGCPLGILHLPPEGLSIHLLIAQELPVGFDGETEPRRNGKPFSHQARQARRFPAGQESIGASIEKEYEWGRHGADTN